MVRVLTGQPPSEQGQAGRRAGGGTPSGSRAVENALVQGERMSTRTRRGVHRWHRQSPPRLRRLGIVLSRSGARAVSARSLQICTVGSQGSVSLIPYVRETEIEAVIHSRSEPTAPPTRSPSDATRAARGERAGCEVPAGCLVHGIDRGPGRVMGISAVSVLCI